MLTSQQKQLFKDLLQGKYLCKRGNRSGGLSYAVYDGNQVLQYKTDVSRDIRGILKKDNKGRYCISRKAVIALHGKCWLKQEYKRDLKSKKAQ